MANKKVTGVILLFLLQLTLFSQAIVVSQFPDFGEQGLLQGNTDVLNPADYSVACYVFVQEAGGWWGPKPSTTNPLTQVNPDGSFLIQFITGGNDQYCSRFFICLWQNGSPDPPYVGGGDLPDHLFDLPYDVVARPHGSRRISWPNGNYNWVVKETFDGNPVGPGNNLFSAGDQNVWIDDDNQLHLKITNQNGAYYSSEIIADTAFGYGKYHFVYHSNPDVLDPGTVFGFFTWDDVSPLTPNPNNYYREIDFEFSRWGNAGDPTNAQFVIQPWDPPGNLLRYNAGTNTGTIHSFTWFKDSVVFVSLNPDSTLIKKWVYTGNYLPAPGKENLRINLWLTTQNPAIQDEIILSDYGFTYLLDAPENLVASKCSGEEISITWDAEPNLFYQVYRSENVSFTNPQALSDEWFHGSMFADTSAEPEKWYYYSVRAADNAEGSNISGYLSGLSTPDSGIVCARQTIQLATNWSGISSNIIPFDNNLDSLFKQLGDDLIILQNQNGEYYPGSGQNTLGTWDYKQGYFIKTASPGQLLFSGFTAIDHTLTLQPGWNLIPVLSACPVETASLFSGVAVTMIKEVAGRQVWWPENEIHALDTLIPGKSYFVLMTTPLTITFPECSGE
jgi:hypothetical protein